MSEEPAEAPERRSLLSVLGPGLVTGAADDDPSGVGTYSQVGAQFGYGNWVGGELKGLQLGAIANVAAGTGGHAGLQLGGIANVARGDFDGGQGAYVANVVTGDMRGAQVGLVNVGGDVTGAQIGLVNIAGLVKGTQIGLLNVSRDVEGIPIGLLNIIATGIFKVAF